MDAEEFMISRVKSYFRRLTEEERKVIEEQVKYDRSLPNDLKPPYEHKTLYQHGLKIREMLPTVDPKEMTTYTLFDDSVDDALRICRDSLY